MLFRSEDFSRGQVLNLKVFRNAAYNKKAGLKIDGVFFRDVTYDGAGDSPSRIRGYTRLRRVTNVTFENMIRNGATVLDPVAGNIVVGPHTANITFRMQPLTRRVGDANPALRYSGRWLRRADAGSDGGDVHTPLRSGSRMAYAFTGRQARLYGLTGPGRGKVDVFLDGAYAATVDTFSLTPRMQQIWFDTGVLRRGAHRLELRYGRSKNVLSTGASVGFDKLEIVQ